MTSLGMRFWRSFWATSRPSASLKYVMRLIHVPNDQSGGISGRPTREVYSDSISFGEPRKMKMSSASSAMKSFVAPM